MVGNKGINRREGEYGSYDRVNKINKIQFLYKNLFV